MRLGQGTETEPFISPDGTAGVADELRLRRERGGLTHLPCGRYDLSSTIEIDTPCTRLEGDVWAYNSDPNGVFETRFGTKLRLIGRKHPALSVGITRTAEGCVIRDLGIQGDIVGMDTRLLLDLQHPLRSSGLTFSHTRIDQAEFSKLSFCGLHCAVCAAEDAEIDACLFEGLNVDGCAVGMYFAPRAAYYVRFRKWVAADNPFYGVYANGHGRQINNLEITDIQFIRTGGAFTDDDGLIHAAVCLDGISGCIFRNNLIDDAGVFWYFAPDAGSNAQHETICRETTGLWVNGHGNRIVDNIIANSHGESIRVQGSGNILLNNIVDHDVIVTGSGHIIQGLVFTQPDARLILSGTDHQVSGVDPSRIVYR